MTIPDAAGIDGKRVLDLLFETHIAPLYLL